MDELKGDILAAREDALAAATSYGWLPSAGIVSGQPLRRTVRVVSTLLRLESGPLQRSLVEVEPNLLHVVTLVHDRVPRALEPLKHGVVARERR